MTGRRLIRHVTLLVAAIIALAVSSGGAWAGYLQLTGNIHQVQPGVYRSKQLEAGTLATFVREKGIRTVLNLRGNGGDEAWYVAEGHAVTSAGARLVDLQMSANNEPDDARLRQLVATLRTVEKPVLVHCNGGADRTGLASALYELLVAGKSAEEAAGQLSFRYGHFPWLGSETIAMDRAFWRVARGEVTP